MPSKSREEASTSSRNDILKLIGVLTMTIDHVGYFFLAGNLELTARLIGRLAFPLFAYHIAVGYRYTSNLKKYVVRLSGLAIVSQLVYALIFPPQLNIAFTLLGGLLLIYAYEENIWSGVLLILVLPLVVKVEYSYFGLLLPLVFYRLQGIKQFIAYLICLTSLLYRVTASSLLVQSASTLALPVIWFDWQRWLPRVRLPKYFFYVFYPGHLGIIFLITNYF